MQDAINVAAQGLGPPVQMVEIPLPEAGKLADARKLDDGEMRILAEKVVEWQEAESEVLTRFVGLTPEPLPAETIPATPTEPEPPKKPVEPEPPASTEPGPPAGSSL